jgi:hypothetical protein
MTPATQQQPEPRPGGVSVTALVLRDVARGNRGFGGSLIANAFRDRRELGIERYDTELQTNNGRDALTDAFQEGLDKALYLRQAIQEAADAGERRRLDRLYRMELIALEEMAEMLHERGEG